MLLHKLIWMGAAYLASREVVRFLQQELSPAQLPPGGSTDAGEGEEEVEPMPLDEDETLVLSISEECVDQEEEDELRVSNHTLAFTTAGLVAATLGWLVHPRLPFLSIPLLIVGIVPPARRAYRQSREAGRLTYSGLEILQATAELAVGQVLLTAAGWLLYSGGKRVLYATRRRARAELVASVTEGESGAWVLCEGVEVLREIEAIEVGDWVVIRSGDVVPVDGKIVEGVVGVDQRALTGEAALCELAEGDLVHAATSVLSGEAIVSAERTGRETVMARVEALLASASSYEQQLTERVTSVTERSVRPTLALAGFGLVTRGPVGVVAGLWTNSLDMVWMSAPQSMFNSIRAAARSGILIKDGRSLELLPRVDTVVFDKTGTLTYDDLEVVSVWVGAGRDELTILRLAAAIEQFQNHPIARAIVAAALRDPRPLPNTEGRRTVIGYGVLGRAGGHDLVIGSLRLFRAEGIDLPAELDGVLEDAAGVGNTTVHIAIDGEFAGCVVLTSKLRPDASALIESLRARGLHVMILSGDEEAPTRALAEFLGIDRYIARALPEAKAQVIAELQEEGRVVCFVGDGINDALAMHRANVSVSLAGSSMMALESAQIILSGGELGQLVSLLQLGEDFRSDQRLLMGSALSVNAINAFGFIFAGFSIATLVGFYGVGISVSVVTSVLPHFRSYDAPQADDSPQVANYALGEASASVTE